MEALYIIHACYICIIICLFIILFLYRQKLKDSRIKEALNEQATLLTNKHYEEKIQDLQDTLTTTKNEHAAQLESLKKEHALNLTNALQDQENTLKTQYTQKQELMQEILQTNQEKQSALMTQRFYEISEQLLEEKNRQFQEKQSDSLKPLCDEIMRFKTEIAQHTKDNQERHIALNTEIKHLKEASLKISADATNLANAMRGDSKLQGQWGEVILERLLESSGLQKDREYYTQVFVKNEAKKRNAWRF